MDTTILGSAIREMTDISEHDIRVRAFEVHERRLLQLAKEDWFEAEAELSHKVPVFVQRLKELSARIEENAGKQRSDNMPAYVTAPVEDEGAKPIASVSTLVDAVIVTKAVA